MTPHAHRDQHNLKVFVQLDRQLANNDKYAGTKDTVFQCDMVLENCIPENTALP